MKLLLFVRFLTTTPTNHIPLS